MSDLFDRFSSVVARLVSVLLTIAALAPIAQASAQAVPRATATGSLDGVVYDSVYARPLANAVVQIAFAANVAISRTTTADARGHFAFDSLPPGQWIVGASHAWLDSLAIVQLTVGVDVKARGTTRTTLAVPAARTLIAQECSVGVARDSSGYLFGTLRGIGASRVPVAGTVRVEWPESEIVRGVFRRRLRELTIATTPTGEYSVCGVPPDGVVRLQAWSGTDSTGVLLAAVPSHGIGRADLALGVARHIALPDTTLASDSVTIFEGRGSTSDSTAPAARITLTVLRGTGVVRGVAQTATGAPLANARATIWGTGVEATSRADGRFTLNDIPTGSRMLEVRAIGYESLRTIVTIADSSPTIVTAALDKPIELTPIQIRAMRSAFMGVDMSGFDKRRRGAIGRFLDTTQLARINAIRPVDIFRLVPGARVVAGPMGDRVVFRSSSRGWCSPSIFVNGVPVAGDGTLDMYVNAADLRGVEIYTNWVLVPTEYTPQTPCGSIVFWTGVTRATRR